MDASEPDDVESTIQATLDAFGRLDVMVNNAGYGVPMPLESLSIEDWNRTLAVTLTSVFLGIKYMVPIFRRQGGGVIVNTASISGIRADYGMGAYNAAKKFSSISKRRPYSSTVFTSVDSSLMTYQYSSLPKGRATAK